MSSYDKGLWEVVLHPSRGIDFTEFRPRCQPQFPAAPRKARRRRRTRPRPASPAIVPTACHSCRLGLCEKFHDFLVDFPESGLTMTPHGQPETRQALPPPHAAGGGRTAMSGLPPTDRLGKYLAMGQVGMEMVAPIVLGLFLDHHFGWQPWCTVVGAIIGLVGGVGHLVQMQKRLQDKDHPQRRQDTP